MNALKIYHYTVGGLRPGIDKSARFVIVGGTTKEFNMVDAFRKVSRDHADILCRGNTYCTIVDPNGKSVTVVTERSED